MCLALYHDTYRCQGEVENPKTIVLLHGWGMNSLVWDDLIPLLINDFQVCVIDLPGFGRSPISSGDYDLQSVMEQVLEVAPQNAIWIGWSLGGLLLQKIVLIYPERVEQGFLIASTPKFTASDDWSLAMPQATFEKFQSLLEEDWQGTLIRFLTLQCKGSESIKEDTRKLREYLFHHGLPATKSLREGLNILGDNDLREQLKEIKVPLVFILGQYDTLVPGALADTLDAAGEHVSVHVVEGASHAAHLSHADKVAEIFFSSLNDQGS